MKIEAKLELHGSVEGADPLNDQNGICLPIDHVICRDLDGTRHTVGEYVWPWTAYSNHKNTVNLHFYYWNQNQCRISTSAKHITPEREGRMRELQFLMTRQLYYGEGNASSTLTRKLNLLRHIARFAEARSCTVREVLTQSSLLDAFGENLPIHLVQDWTYWFSFLLRLNPETQLGFALATPKKWKDIRQRAREYQDSRNQFAPLPTRIYALVINNLSTELDDIEAHKSQLLTALREAVAEYQQAKEMGTARISIGPGLVAKHNLATYFERCGYTNDVALRTLSLAIRDIFRVCKLQIHIFSGMRDNEARLLPYHCMVTEMGHHGRKHSLIAGLTTKFNKGRRLRTKWVTTEHDGFRAIKLAQEFATVIYESFGLKPSKAEDLKDNYPLFPSTKYLPWVETHALSKYRIATAGLSLKGAIDPLLLRLSPSIREEDIAELEDIEPFRAWLEEPEFAVGQPWPLSTHQLRRSLAVYANASGLVRISSLRRQLQHMTREMALYYGRGSTFCKNFISDDPDEYKKHIAVDWQDGAEEAEMLAFVRDVLNSTETMFGGAGNFYERQRERGEVMSRDEVAKQIKAGLLAYREGPLGGCTRPGVCETRKGLNLIDTVCASNGCKNLIGKHSKIVQTIRLKRAAMAHITPGSITEAMEKEELESLERVEREWRPQVGPAAYSTGDRNG